MKNFININWQHNAKVVPDTDLSDIDFFFIKKYIRHFWSLFHSYFIYIDKVLKKSLLIRISHNLFGYPAGYRANETGYKKGGYPVQFYIIRLIQVRMSMVRAGNRKRKATGARTATRCRTVGTSCGSSTTWRSVLCCHPRYILFKNNISFKIFFQ